MPEDYKYEGWPWWLMDRKEFIREGFFADYISYDAQQALGEEREQNARLLILTQRSLEGFELNYRRGKKADSACQISLAAVPLGAIASIESEARVDKWADGIGERAQSGTIHLDRELGPWGTDIHLPLSPLDYGGDRKASAWAAGVFMYRLKYLLGQIRVEYLRGFHAPV